MSSTARNIRPISIEGLEGRRLLAATIEFADGVLNIQGDPGVANQVRVYTQLRAGNLVAMAGAARKTIPLSDVKSIQVIGGDGDDRILLGENLKIPATLDGRAGNDLLYAGAANDTLLGGSGNDKLVGRRGNDRIVGGGGNDIYVGGPGRNSYDRSQPNWIDDNPVPTPTHPVLQAPYPASVADRPIALQHPNGGTISLGRSVKLFKNNDGTAVAGDGVQDDTTGIQKAIDSLPNSQGIPQGNVSSGGTIFLPPGTYRITRPLVVPGAVILSGAGPQTVIQYEGSTGAAVEFVEDPDFGVDYIAGAGATDMTIRADRAGGFAVRSSTRQHVQLMRFRDLVIDTAGWGINLLAGDSITQNCFFDNLLFRNVGAGAINVSGNANKLNAIRVEGDIRPSFSAQDGIVVVQGSGTSITNCVIGGAAADAGVGFFVSGVSNGVGGGVVTFKNNSVDAPGVAGPGGIARFVFSDVNGGSIDDLGGRKAKFVKAVGVRITRQWVDGTASELPRFLDADADSRVLVDQVYSPLDAASGNSARGLVHVTEWKVAALADYLAARGDTTATLPASPAVGRVATSIGVNVKEFVNDDGVSVRGDGVHDDTTGIQKAIDLFLANRDNPSAPQSGAVYLPTGVYRITASLKLPSGVVLLGDGSGSVIRYAGPSGGAAVRFSDPSGAVVGAGLQNLGLGNENGPAIGDVVGVPVANARLSDLVINCSGWGIDLRDLRDSTISNVHQKKLGLGSIRVNGRGNLVYAVNTEFGVRTTFSADPALVVVKGTNNTVTGCVVEGVPSGSAHAYYASGTGLTFANNWAEIASDGPLAAKGKVAFIFENLRDSRIQELYLLNTNHKAQFINSQATISVLDTLAESQPLSDYVIMDANTTLNMDLAITRHGLGAATAGTFRAAQELVIFPGGDIYKYGTWNM
jgi:hypothetical protein